MNQWADQYQEFIDAARQRGRVPGRRHHEHHIVPRVLGGKDNPDNLVVLTIREHLWAHYLLYKMQTNVYDRKIMFRVFTRMKRSGRYGNYKNKDYKGIPENEVKQLSTLRPQDVTRREGLDRLASDHLKFDGKFNRNKKRGSQGRQRQLHNPFAFRGRGYGKSLNKMIQVS